MKKILSTAIALVASFLIFQTISQGQPTNWLHGFPITITENSGVELLDHQVPIEINTEVLIAAGNMDSNGDDIRFAKTCGSGPLEYWIEDGINTTTTEIWVKMDTIPASGSVTIMMFYGNPSASAQSSIDIFEGPFSGSDNITGGLTQGSSDRQRGFFFRGSRDILVTKFGKNEPNGTTRYLTLFDSLSQSLLHQMQVTGASPATLTYTNLSQPMWLNSGQTYLISIHLGSGDQYFNSQGNTQVGPYLRYGRTGWCNTCDQNTFPENSTTGHYGYPDFEYYVRDSAGVYPTYQIVQPLSALQQAHCPDQMCSTHF